MRPPQIPAPFTWIVAPLLGMRRREDVWVVVLGTEEYDPEVARVVERVDGAGWLAEIGRYREERRHVIAPSQADAAAWVARWVNRWGPQIEAEVLELRAKKGRP